MNFFVMERTTKLCLNSTANIHVRENSITENEYSVYVPDFDFDMQ